MSGPEHLRLWKIAANVPLNQGGLGGKLSRQDRKLLHKFIDMRYDHSPMDKRHLPSHNARLMGKIFKDNWNARAVRNAVALHAVGDMYNSHRTDLPHKAGVNGHNYSVKKGREAEKIITALKAGKAVHYPRWAMKEGGRFKYDKAVIQALKEQSSHIIWLNRISGIVKAAPYIYYSVQAGRIWYVYTQDAHEGEKLLLHVSTSAVVGSTLFQTATSVVSLGSSSLASIGVGGALLSFVIPATVSAAGVYAVEHYLESQKIETFEELIEHLEDITSLFLIFSIDSYEEGTDLLKDGKRRIEKFIRSNRKELRAIQKSLKQFEKESSDWFQKSQEMILDAIKQE